MLMRDADLVAMSPSSVGRVLGQAGLLGKWKGEPSKKGTGFEQPLQPHQHWQIHISYLNISGTFYYLCRVLDGYSRFVVHLFRFSVTWREGVPRLASVPPLRGNDFQGIGV